MTDVSYHINLEVARRELKDASNLNLEYLASDIIPSVSSSLDLECGEEFEPYHETRIVYPNPVSLSPDYKVLRLFDPATQRKMRLLELEAVVSGTRSLTLDTEVVMNDASGMGSQQLRLIARWKDWKQFCFGNYWTGTGWRTWYNQTLDRYAVQVTGWWGCRERYVTDGWRAVDKVAADIGATDSALTVQGGVGLRTYDGSLPRFAPGTLLKIGSEVLRVIAVDGAKGIPFVLRGLKGTAAATHALDDVISTWSVQPEIVRAAQRWVTLLQGRQSVFETTVITDMGSFRLPDDMPSDVQNLLRRWLR